MRTARIIALVGALFVGLSGDVSAQLSQGEKDTIFIGPVKVNSGVVESARKSKRDVALEQLAQALRTELVTEINQTRVFTIVESR